MTNRCRGVLYVGVSSDMPRRVWEHRRGLVEGFTSRYGLKLLVYYEWHDRILDAIQREKNLKHWKRSWKFELIEGMNPNWDDLYETLNA
jgi:putative endonuclease